MLPIEGSARGAVESSVEMNSSSVADCSGLLDDDAVRGVVVGREVGVIRGGR